MECDGALSSGKGNNVPAEVAGQDGCGSLQLLVGAISNSLQQENHSGPRMLKNPRFHQMIL